MKAIVKEAAKYVGISTGIALGIFCFVGMIFDLYYGGNFSLSGYQFTKMVVGCVVVGWGFGIPAVVYRKENMPMPIRVVIHMGSGCVIYTLVAYFVGCEVLFSFARLPIPPAVRWIRSKDRELWSVFRYCRRRRASDKPCLRDTVCRQAFPHRYQPGLP